MTLRRGQCRWLTRIRLWSVANAADALEGIGRVGRCSRPRMYGLTGAGNAYSCGCISL